MAPGRLFSMTTSAPAQRSRASCRSVSDLRLSAIERLLRFTEAKFSLKPSVIGGQKRMSSPVGFSTLMTSAPISESSMPQNGPDRMLVNSMTRTSFSGSMGVSCGFERRGRTGLEGAVGRLEWE